MATSIQSWRLSSLRARLNFISEGHGHACPSIMFYSKSSQRDEKNETKLFVDNDNKSADYFLSSHLCSNKTVAKLGDLLWNQGDKRLCTIYPQQNVDLSDWLVYPYGKTIFPLYTHNYNQASKYHDYKMYVLVETDIDTYRPFASIMATKLEDYGLIIAWTVDQSCNLIIETDLDHITKFAITIMQGQTFANNGLLLTRFESVSISGNPCIYDNEHFSSTLDRKLTGTTQWETYVRKLRLLCKTARIVFKDSKALEVEEIPGLIVSPGFVALSSEESACIELLPLKKHVEEQHTSCSLVPKTPPPTPVTINTVMNEKPATSSESIKIPALTQFILQDIPSTENIITEKRKLKTPMNENNKGYTINVKIPTDNNTWKFSTFNVPIKPCVTDAKPPNILIYADSTVARNNVQNVLESSLDLDKYLLYSLSSEDTRAGTWINQTALLVVCGNVESDIAGHFVEYIIRGGKLLALCSDMLHTLLPHFKTAEVREHELVCFSYKKWKHVRMMHHIFCYQASPVKTRFSQEHEDVKVNTMDPPISASIKDKQGRLHRFNVDVLGTEETWHTPSILLANLLETGGKAVFSQIHLEADPAQYEFEENKFNILKQNNSARLDIFKDLLSVHLEMKLCSSSKSPIVYTPGFFLGRHELKLEMLGHLKTNLQQNDILKLPKLDIQFCGRKTTVQPATPNFFPVMIHQCPDNFSTIEYFENLNTKELGRLVIYTDVTTSTMNVCGLRLYHGLAVITRQQTLGRGRSKNAWLSPKGCAMFNLQLHIPINSSLGRRISIIQSVMAVAAVTAVKSIPEYQVIDLRIKWPNDIYTGRTAKIGGILVTNQIDCSCHVCNIGTGINLSNTSPTVCINDLIKLYNQTNEAKLPLFTLERYTALVFNEMENLINLMQTDKMNDFFQLYYKYWMHSDETVTVQTAKNNIKEVKIIGIDEFGFLKVQENTGNVFSIQPDGNSFDLMKGLIAPR
ncbi:biotin--protein ligase-like isoform X2 [Prorops nasuta]|uniref:biotin--protein ligase-like isoform X2 n=1 Tax=Prorops nasuta TaxID=863751 RepID=UPI0034CFAC79